MEQSAKWRGLFLEQLSSGQTMAAFCRDRGIRDSQFYDWKKRVREGEAAEFVEVKVKASSDQRTLASERYPAIEIRQNKGRSLLVGPVFDVGHLRALVAVLKTEA
jgi:transposase-like protein